MRSAIAIACGAIAIAEAVSYLAIARILRAPISLAALNQRADRIAEERPEEPPPGSEPPPRDPAGDVVHPYVGFVAEGVDPAGSRPHGFAESERALPRRSPDAFVVGIAGGSAARRVLGTADRALAPVLARSPALAGRRVVVVALADAGWKEPQPLLALSYLLALGGELDALVEIDAEEEVIPPALANVRSGVAPSFPQDWRRRTRALPDPVALPILGRIAYLETTRRALADRQRGTPLRWSALAAWIWLARDRRLEGEIAQARELLQAHPSAHTDHAWMGAPPAVDRDGGEDAVAWWRRSSTQLFRLCRANGIAYLHVVYPGAHLGRECERLAASGVPCRVRAAPPRGEREFGERIASLLLEQLR